MNKPLLLIFASALALSACNSHDNGIGAQEQKAGSAVGVDLASIDKSVAPGDNFSQSANGSWVKTHDIPADRSSIGAFFTARQEVEKQNLDLISGLLKANPDANSNEGRITAFY